MKQTFIPTVGLLVAIFGVTFGRQVIKYDGPELSFEEKWSWAMKEGSSRSSRSGFWIAYSIKRLMDENSYIATGMHFSGSVDNSSSLYDVIFENLPHAGTSADSSRKRRGSGLSMMNRGRKTIFKVIKDVAILFYSSGGTRVDEVQLANMELNFDLKKKPLMWMGSANDDVSVSNLEKIYRDASSAELKENIVNAIGIHQQALGSFSFLVKTLKSQEPVKARSQAAFWIGHLARPEALSVLFEVAQSNDAREVREQTVFAISQIESDEALDKLVSLARKANDSEVRRKATFWLGQKASKKAVGALEEMLADDDDTEVQKQALFALAQMRGGSGLEKLIQVAKTHPKLKIRKQAIISLGNSDDPRATEALIEIARSR